MRSPGPVASIVIYYIRRMWASLYTLEHGRIIRVKMRKYDVSRSIKVSFYYLAQQFLFYKIGKNGLIIKILRRIKPYIILTYILSIYQKEKKK